MGYEQALLQSAIEQNKPNGMMVLVAVDVYEEINIYEVVGVEAVNGQNSVYAIVMLQFTYGTEKTEEMKSG